jgi:multidrug resistance efflux pump
LIARHRSLLFAAAWLAPWAAQAAVFSGEVRALDAQPIFTPPSMSSPVVLRYYMPDGAQVKQGDVVLRIDAGQAAAEMRTLDTQAEQTAAKIDKEAGELELKAADAQLALIDAQAALDTAKIDAALPQTLVSALDFDRYQNELQRAEHDLELKQQQLADARAAAVRRREDGKLELAKSKLQHDYDQAQVDSAEVHAERSGTVVHGFNLWFGTGRYEEGSSAYPGNEVGQIVDTGGRMSVRAWVFESDHAGLGVGQNLLLSFDALPGTRTEGKIAAISGAPESRAQWGEGKYFVVDIDLPANPGLPLKPGMSVRVDSASAQAQAAPAAASIKNEPVRANGEVYAQITAAISPPQVEDLWQMTITQMAGDGAQVKKDQQVVSFDGGETMKKLATKQGELEAKLREQEKLRLELGERARTEEVTVAEADAEATKAQRKANQPEAYVPGVEFKKLLIARRKAEQHAAASRERAAVAATERTAEQRLVDVDAKRLKDDVERLQATIASLNVSAPRDGIFLHGTMWGGEKIDVGKQIWRGQSVGEIPDMNSLAVRVYLAERDLSRVRRGDGVRVLLEGGAGQSLSGRVDEIGLSMHSKSRVDPVPVVDVRIALDPTDIKLKPGQAVRTEFLPGQAEMATK